MSYAARLRESLLEEPDAKAIDGAALSAYCRAHAAALGALEIDITDWGAVPGEDADPAANTEAILAACLRATELGGARVIAPTGTYLCNRILVPGGMRFIWEGRNATLQFVEVPPNGQSCFHIGAESDFVELAGLGANLNQYDGTTTLAAPPAIEAGDLYIVWDDDDYSWDMGDLTRPYYKKGDFFRARSVAGSVITNESVSFGTYLTSENIRVIKLITNSVHFEGKTTILVPDEPGVISGGIQLWNGYRCSLDGIEADGAKWGHINLYRCYETIVERLYVCNYAANVDRNYGVIMLSSYACLVVDSWIRVGRHAVTITGGSVVGTHPNRLCGIDGGTYKGDLIALDMHGACEWVTFADSFVDGGVNVAGDHWEVRGCTILDCTHPTDFTGVALRVREDKGASGTIEDTTLIARFAPSGDDSLLSLFYGAPDRGGTISIKDLRLEIGSLALDRVATIDLGGPSAGPVNVDIDGVVCRSEAAAEPQFTVSCASAAFFERISIRNTKGVALRAATIAAKQVTVDGGVEVLGADAAGVLVQFRAWPSGSQQQRATLRGITALYCGTHGINVAGASASDDIYVTVTDSLSVNNGQAGGSSATRTSVAASNLQSVIIANNILGDTQASPTQASRCAVVNCGTYQEYNNRQEKIGAQLFDSISGTTTLLSGVGVIRHVVDDVASTAQTPALDIACLASHTTTYRVQVEAEDASGDRASLVLLVHVLRSGSGTPPTPTVATLLSVGSGLTFAATISGSSLRLRTTNGMGADAHITTQVREESRMFTAED